MRQVACTVGMASPEGDLQLMGVQLVGVEAAPLAQTEPVGDGDDGQAGGDHGAGHVDEVLAGIQAQDADTARLVSEGERETLVVASEDAWRRHENHRCRAMRLLQPLFGRPTIHGAAYGVRIRADPTQGLPRAAMSPAASGVVLSNPLPRRTFDAQRDLFDERLA
ncbi:hypothetical protein [Streptomyces sp. SD31]|uniref:hypothetical protein n=1 Tax=Streptomyces sp. SD31 TaxID=3452208 RepID=UPI003F8A6623